MGTHQYSTRCWYAVGHSIGMLLLTVMALSGSTLNRNSLVLLGVKRFLGSVLDSTYCERRVSGGIEDRCLLIRVSQTMLVNKRSNSLVRIKNSDLNVQDSKPITRLTGLLGRMAVFYLLPSVLVTPSLPARNDILCRGKCGS